MSARFLAGRLLDLAVVLLGVSMVVFLMIRLIPGDAVAIMLGANTEVTPERIAELEARLGLDQPIPVQYVRLAVGCAARRPRHLDLDRPPGDAGDREQHLADARADALSVLVGAGLAIPIGAFMASARGGATEVAVRVGAIAGLTIPSFWLGIVSIFLVARFLPGVSALGYVPFTEDPLGNLQRMILPVIALSLPMLANLSRLVRSAMLDALGQDYVRTARAKGAGRRRVVYRHALRNALIPFITSVGVSMGYLLGGAIVVEQVFADPRPWPPGAGRDQRAQLPAGAGDDPGDDGQLRDRELPRRPGLRRDRPAGVALMRDFARNNKPAELRHRGRCWRRSSLAVAAPILGPCRPVPAGDGRADAGAERGQLAGHRPARAATCWRASSTATARR